MQQNITLFELAKHWVGVKFRWHGYTRIGCDCIGLVVGMLKENNIIDETFIQKFKSYRYGNNLKNIDQEQMLNDLFYCFDETGSLKEADLLWVSLKNSPIHFVIIERNNHHDIPNIIHTTQEAGKCFISTYCDEFCINKMFKLKTNAPPLI